MFGSALYYPHIDIPDREWIRSAIIFWDRIKTIAPLSIENPYQNKDTHILYEEGIIEPLRCELYPQTLDSLATKIINLVEGSLTCKVGSEDPNAHTLLKAEMAGNIVRDNVRSAHIHPKKFSHMLINFIEKMKYSPTNSSPNSDKPLKFAPELREIMHYYGRSGNEDNWLIVDNFFAAFYMSALASLLAKDTGLSALTNEEMPLGFSLQSVLSDINKNLPEGKDNSKGALVSFVMETIRIDPQTDIQKIINFRRSRETQIAELSAQFSEISAKLPLFETETDLKENVKDTYSKKIRPKLESLKDELNDVGISSIWEGFQRAVTYTLPAGSAIGCLTGITGTTLIAAGAAIAITDVAIKNHLASKKIRRASPYTYLLDVKRKFSTTS
ncbi:hypothetical protein AZC_0339 [Azorhizobium caulinodans ORS 571]|uniref:Uncharacterized protein n=1 Tax=Azorhizobium caulinodans (strain ATCC 43989 / DSM 5975 / JCM 20966 / LMG 6465 / NBRC 14845 / NCIMB 13405 / ORS 571) TaxID=438753 RepID=A8IJP8_AZOC5|nr:hypothetical protein [Azorhizobium caulinodans]BAF86337.1 hypothetical protein AZC_0339 [Azorhizobium caulinodans ORS 571]